MSSGSEWGVVNGPSQPRGISKRTLRVTDLQNTEYPSSSYQYTGSV